jgi:hypothetical protein
MKIKITMVLTVVGIMTVCLVAPNHAFAATGCNLTLKADPGSGSLATGKSIEQKLSGTLTCGGTGLRGGTITFSGLPPGMTAAAVTDSSGNYQGPQFMVHPDDSFTVSAHYGGDSEHLGAAAGIAIKMSTK